MKMERCPFTNRHHGETVYVVGKGPSLRGFDFGKLRGRTVIVINAAMLMLPNAPYWLFYDNHRICEQEDWFRIFKGRAILARYFNSSCLPKDERLHFYREGNACVPGRRWNEFLYYGNNTAVLATNIAAVLGAARIELLGIDLGDAGTGHNSLFDRDAIFPRTRVLEVTESFKELRTWLMEWEIEVVTRCRFQFGRPATNLRDLLDPENKTIFRALPLEALE